MSVCVRNFRTKNYQNLIIGFQVTGKNVGDVFLGTQCILMTMFLVLALYAVVRVHVVHVTNIARALGRQPPTFGPSQSAWATDPPKLAAKVLHSQHCHLSLSGLIPIWLGLRRGVFTSVGWQVTLCDPIWQVTLRSSEMGSLIRSYMRPF